MKYRKKPVVIDAIQFTDAVTVMQWVESFEGEIPTIAYRSDGIVIATLEGQMRADPDDWIIRGVQGKFYPCKPDIFEATYEAAE
jgi:hypothetical protein